MERESSYWKSAIVTSTLPVPVLVTGYVGLCPECMMPRPLAPCALLVECGTWKDETTDRGRRG